MDTREHITSLLPVTTEKHMKCLVQRFFFKAEIFTVAAKLKSVSMHTLSEVGVKGLNDIFPNQFGIFGGPATWIGMDKGVFYGGFIW